MKISFQTPARKRVVVTISIVFATAYLGFAARDFVADWLGNRAERKSLELAARLDPTNADYRNHLGRYYDLVAHDPAAAIGYYRAAVQLNPHSARYWFDLASAYQLLEDTSSQTAALERAVQADPMTPDVVWEAANVHMVQGQTYKALRELRIVLANDSTMAAAAILSAWRINPDVDVLLRDVVPPSADAYIAFLTLLETKQETSGTAKVWDALMQTHQSFETRYLYDYFRYLIQHKDVDQAVLVWRQAANRFGLSSYLPSPSNLVVNGNFNLNVLNGGFDWQYQKQQGVTLILDPNNLHAGRRSFLIEFDGPGITDAGIYQYIPVRPNTTYEFSAYYKNGELEGAGGPHFTVQDMYSLAVYFDSGELTEAGGFWKSVDGEFTTSPDCKLVVLRVRRLPEGSPIRGKLWIDDFQVIRKPS